MKKSIFNYENGLLMLLSVTFGLVFVDRFALVYLTPYIAKDLNLSNTQIGILVSALSLTWALSGYFSTAWAEANNKKKSVFIGAVILFSVCSISSGLTAGFAGLLIARLLMGLFEGPALPLIQSFLARESTPSRLGFNMGALQSFGSTLFGFILAPLVLVFLADKLGWRSAFYIAGAPGLIMAFLCWKFIRPATAASIKKVEENSLSFSNILAFKNIKLAIILSCLFMTWLNSCMTFMPQYFTTVQGFSEAEMGKTMGLMGLSSFVSGIVVSILSDKFGRKPIIIFFVLVGIFFPLGILFLKDSGVQIPAMFIAYFMFGTFPIVLSVIPYQTVPKHSVGKTIGLIAGSGELVGGMLAPFLGGVAADKYGLSAPFWIAFGAAVLALIFTFFLEEPKTENS
jgi:predicted MFS family arabinose efflux permease